MKIWKRCNCEMRIREMLADATEVKISLNKKKKKYRKEGFSKMATKLTPELRKYEFLISRLVTLLGE